MTKVRKPVRGFFKICPVTRKLVPLHEVAEEPTPEKLHVKNDEMPATKHPIDGKVYTSKAKFRSVTKAHGGEEIGTEYEHIVKDDNYDPYAEKNRNLEEQSRQKQHERLKNFINTSDPLRTQLERGKISYEQYEAFKRARH